ncbi:MAG: hypothetical protein H0U50_12870 [Pyrinomonadaceae bacterium]|nr:hypothetical protein [Pyrinomonadaceae bacterium]
MKRVFITTLILAVFVFTEMQNINGQINANSDNAKIEAEIGTLLRDFYDAFRCRDAAGSCCEAPAV